MSKLKWPHISVIHGLTEHQQSQVVLSLSAPIGILGGTPGTGKTYVAAAVIKAVVAANSVWQIAVAGPTGKSAVRITEAMQQYGITDLTASTIHRLLGVKRSGHDGKGWGFMRDASNPLPHRFIFITEASMIDTDLMASLLLAIEPGTHLFIEGDVGQLPPVGHGAPLRDMIAAGIHYGELTEIKRNSGTIVEACREIRAGRPWKPSPHIDTTPGVGLNLLHVESGRSATSIEQLKQMLLSTPADIDPAWDCQVLCQVNEKSDLSRKNLNKLLQEWLNPHGKKLEGNPYRLGDKVICTSNTLLDLVPDDPLDSLDSIAKGNGREYQHDPGNPNGLREFVANGEIGYVVHVEEKLFHVRFDSPARTVKVPLTGKKSEARGDAEHAGAACDFDLGYAITTHKSQGSQWKIVFVMIDDYPGASMVACRELVYTALSRAQTLCVTIGRKSVMDQWCRKVSLPRRKTFLKEEIGDCSWN
jgi:exodeoxyribonuclease V alpha subunit